MLTLIVLADVGDHPKAKMELPSPLRLGDHLQLDFTLTRQNKGRSEVLKVFGTYKITAYRFDASRQPVRQLISVESTQVAPAWKAVKKTPEQKRSWAPTKSPRKVVE